MTTPIPPLTEDQVRRIVREEIARAAPAIRESLRDELKRRL